MFGRSKERSFILLILSMAAVGFFMFVDAGLSGGTRTNPLIGGAVLAVQAAILIWLFTAEDHGKAALVGEVAAAAPFALVFIWAKVR